MSRAKLKALLKSELASIKYDPNACEIILTTDGGCIRTFGNKTLRLASTCLEKKIIDLGDWCAIFQAIVYGFDFLESYHSI